MNNKESQLYEDIKAKYGNAITKDMYNKIRESVINDPDTIKEIRTIEEEIAQKSEEIQRKYEAEKKEILKEQEQLLKEIAKLEKKLKANVIATAPKDQQYRGLATPNSLVTLLGVRREDYLPYKTYQDQIINKKEILGTFRELDIDKERREQTLQFLLELILSDNTLTNAEKSQAINNIEAEDVDYEVSRWLGKRLTMHARKVLRALRAAISKITEYREFIGHSIRVGYKELIGQNVKESILIGDIAIEVKILLSRIYEEYGLTSREDGSYDYNQTKIIQDILFGITDKGLHAEMLFKYKYITKTKMILHIQAITRKALFEKESGLHEEKWQVIGASMLLPSILFISDDNSGNFYQEDPDGYRRFMEIPGMQRSETAFNILEYLEKYLSNKLDKRPLNLIKLLAIAGAKLQERYRESKKRGLGTIELILNNMVKAKYLISDWSIEKGAKGQQKYLLNNLRKNIFLKNNSVPEVTSSLKKKNRISHKKK